MASLRKDVGLIRNLVTFEVAARTLNFTHAAQEMGVSRVAVSRQIADIEAAINQKLFTRNHRNVELTAAGKSLAASISPAFNMISDGLALVRGGTSVNRLSLTTTTAFATYWLMPRLVDFSRNHPEIEVNLVVSDKYLDLESERIDVAIRYDRTPPKIGRVTRLLQERIFPVYSPQYTPVSKLQTHSDLLEERLLQLSGNYRPETGWQHWFKTHGIKHEGKKPIIMVNTYINVLQAAMEGQGIALAGFPLVNTFLEKGTLKTIDAIEPMDREYFYLINNTVNNTNATDFCNWITDQMA
jgi:LysR family transcriptional regulator, glycine cleavage system transcriptional activator